MADCGKVSAGNCYDLADGKQIYFTSGSLSVIQDADELFSIDLCNYTVNISEWSFVQKVIQPDQEVGISVEPDVVALAVFAQYEDGAGQKFLGLKTNVHEVTPVDQSYTITSTIPDKWQLMSKFFYMDANPTWPINSALLFNPTDNPVRVLCLYGTELKQS